VLSFSACLRRELRSRQALYPTYGFPFHWGESFVLVSPGRLSVALELEEMILTRRPEEIFAAEDEPDWNEWVEFFSRTREADGRRKGIVEVSL